MQKKEINDRMRNVTDALAFLSSIGIVKNIERKTVLDTLMKIDICGDAREFAQSFLFTIEDLEQQGTEDITIEHDYCVYYDDVENYVCLKGRKLENEKAYLKRLRKMAFDKLDSIKQKDKQRIQDEKELTKLQAKMEKLNKRLGVS